MHLDGLIGNMMMMMHLDVEQAHPPPNQQKIRLSTSCAGP
jgi:hypothetical protein